MMEHGRLGQHDGFKYKFSVQTHTSCKTLPFGHILNYAFMLISDVCYVPLYCSVMMLLIMQIAPYFKPVKLKIFYYINASLVIWVTSLFISCRLRKPAWQIGHWVSFTVPYLKCYVWNQYMNVFTKQIMIHQYISYSNLFWIYENN